MFSAPTLPHRLGASGGAGREPVARLLLKGVAAIRRVSV
jgi:hypothetical protein